MKFLLSYNRIVTPCQYFFYRDDREAYPRDKERRDREREIKRYVSPFIISIHTFRFFITYDRIVAPDKYQGHLFFYRDDHDSHQRDKERCDRERERKIKRHVSRFNITIHTFRFFITSLKRFINIRHIFSAEMTAIHIQERKRDMTGKEKAIGTVINGKIKDVIGMFLCLLLNISVFFEFS